MYGVFKLFSAFGEIYNIRETHELYRQIHIYYETITSDRIERKRQRDAIIINQNKFVFRYKGLCDYPEPCTLIDEKIQAKMREIALYTNDMQKIPPATSSPKHILNILDDERLLKIFNELSLSDLCDVASVCERFKAIAMKLFIAKYKNELAIMWILERGALKITPLTLSRIGLCLETFGSEITRFETLSYGCLNRKIILSLFDEHCRHLMYVSIQASAFDADVREFLRCSVPHMKELSLYGARCMQPSTIELIKQLLAIDCKTMYSLEMLELGLFMDDTLDSIKTPIQFPNMHTMKLYVIELKLHTLDLLFSGNPQLRHIILDHLEMSTHILRLLPHYLPNIEEIHFANCAAYDYYLYGRSNIDWGQFKCLTSLKLTSFRYDAWMHDVLGSLVVSKVPLQSLDIRIRNIGNDVGLFEYIGQLKHIKHLHFEGLPYLPFRIDDRFERLVRDLPNLSNINFTVISIALCGIKHILRQFVSMTSAFITFSASFCADIRKEDIDEISEIVDTHPRMQLLVRYESSGFWNVSFFSLLCK